MQKWFIDLERGFSLVILALLFLSIFASAALVTPTARAQSIWVTLNPSEGPIGTQVTVQITNYQYGDTAFTVAFGTTIVGTIVTGSSSSASTTFYVPAVSPGEYPVTVSTSSGEFGSGTFTVTQAGYVAPTETPAATPVETPPTEPSTGIPIGGGPTYTPVTPKAGFWSPLNVVIVALVVAAVCFVTVVFVRRGRQERSSFEDSSGYKPGSATESTQPYGSRSSVEGVSPYRSRSSVQEASPYRYRSPLEDTSPYKFRSSAPDTSPYYPGSYVSSTRSTVPPTVSPTVSRSPAPPPYTKVCKHCKRVVRDDLNVCPYCYKRLR